MTYDFSDFFDGFVFDSEDIEKFEGYFTSMIALVSLTTFVNMWLRRLRTNSILCQVCFFILVFIPGIKRLRTR